LAFKSRCELLAESIRLFDAKPASETKGKAQPAQIFLEHLLRVVRYGGQLEESVTPMIEAISEGRQRAFDNLCRKHEASRSPAKNLDVCDGMGKTPLIVCMDRLRDVAPTGRRWRQLLRLLDLGARVVVAPSPLNAAADCKFSEPALALLPSSNGECSARLKELAKLDKTHGDTSECLEPLTSASKGLARLAGERTEGFEDARREAGRQLMKLGKALAGRIDPTEFAEIIRLAELDKAPKGVLKKFLSSLDAFGAAAIINSETFYELPVDLQMACKKCCNNGARDALVDCFEIQHPTVKDLEKVLSVMQACKSLPSSLVKNAWMFVQSGLEAVLDKTKADMKAHSELVIPVALSALRFFNRLKDMAQLYARGDSYDALICSVLEGFDTHKGDLGLLCANLTSGEIQTVAHAFSYNIQHACNTVLEFARHPSLQEYSETMFGTLLKQALRYAEALDRRDCVSALAEMWRALDDPTKAIIGKNYAEELARVEKLWPMK
jgi:hypothetical protein